MRLGMRLAFVLGLISLFWLPQSVLAQAEEQPEAPGHHSSTLFGLSGGLRVVDAVGGQPGTFRTQLALSYMSTSDFIEAGDEASQTSGILALSWAVNEFLEVSGAFASRATTNSVGKPGLIQILGDTVVGVKVHADVMPWLSLGGDLQLMFLNSVGELGPSLRGTNVLLRGAATADLRGLQNPIELILRGNLGYQFDNSAVLIEGVESDRVDRYGEYDEAAFLSRTERFGLGINRVDRIQIGLGLELPIQVAQGFFVHPLLEYRVGIGVNRQDYSCLEVATRAGLDGADGCLDLQGLAAMPSSLSLGARVLPAVQGLAVMLAVDIGLSGTSVFVRELAPTAPYMLHGAVSYQYEPNRPPEIREVERVVEIEKAPPVEPRIDGIVQSQDGLPIVGAVIHYGNQGLTAQMSGAAGQFLSYRMPAGAMTLQITHPDYEPGSCAVQIPTAEQMASNVAPLAQARSAAQAPEPAAALPVPGIATISPLGDGSDIGFGTGAPPTAEPDPAFTPAIPAIVMPSSQAVQQSRQVASSIMDPRLGLLCTLVAKPLLGVLSGTVLDVEGRAVAGAAVSISGPAAFNLVTTADGRFSTPDVEAGGYAIRVDAEGFLLAVATADVQPGGTSTLAMQLTPKPQRSQVVMSTREVKIRRKILFKSSSAEIRSRSHNLLREIADVLLRNPQIRRIEIQGHSDNRGNAESNRQLSESRAQAVRTFLVEAGIDEGRLEAKGYGDRHPLVPNLTDRNRARNRRVQFMIRTVP